MVTKPLHNYEEVLIKKSVGVIAVKNSTLWSFSDEGAYWCKVTKYYAKSGGFFG